MLKSSVCKYSNGNIFVNQTIFFVGAEANNATAADSSNKEPMLKNCPVLTDCIIKKITHK